MKAKMMKIALLLGLSSLSTNVFAGDSVQHASNASKHSVKAVGELAKAGVKTSAAVVSVPLIVVGTVGAASAHAGEASFNFAVGKDGELPIAEEVIVAGPSPQQAMSKEEDK